MVIQKLTTDIDKDRVVRNEEKENKKSIMSSCSEIHYPRLRTTVMLSYTYIAPYRPTSAVRFFEGYLPHNTIISDHDQRGTNPKMSTIAPPNIPW